MQMKRVFLISCLGACVLAGLLYGCASAPSAVPAYAAQPASPPAVEALPITLYTGASPLTGLALQEGAPVGKRPLAVMVDNVKVALPQRGLSAADLVYEIVTESGITRMMAVYADFASMPETGPVRSARDQHVQLALPLGALMLHVGGSTYANQMLESYHYEDKSINGYYEAGALQLDVDRNTTVNIAHCWFTNGHLFDAAAGLYALDTAQQAPIPAFQFVPYDAPERVLSGGAATDVYLRFSSYANSTLHYDATTKRYQKSQFGAAQVDENTGEQLAFDNALVLFTDITKYPDGVLAKVRYDFGGVGYYFHKGAYEEVRWMKGAPEAPLRIVSTDGTETPVALNPGTTYVAMVDLEKYPHFKISSAKNLPEMTLPTPQSEDMLKAPDV